jgi:hypothetical protein
MKSENSIQWRIARASIKAVQIGYLKHTDLLALPIDVLKKIERNLNKYNMWNKW